MSIHTQKAKEFFEDACRYTPTPPKTNEEKFNFDLVRGLLSLAQAIESIESDVHRIKTNTR